MHTKAIYINFKGGIISPGYLLRLLNVAEASRVTELRFGLRQQLIMEMNTERLQAFEETCLEKNITFHTNESRLPNLVSAYAGVNIFTPESWLSEGIYKDVFDLFTFPHLLKINICDSKQTFTPLFSGHLNWVSSDHRHYWYLYMRFPGTERLYCWPELVYTNDLANVSAQLEKFILAFSTQHQIAGHPETEVLRQLMKQTVDYISMPLTDELHFPSFHLPYYEGFNKEGNGYWLGIYRRDEIFSLAFLKAVCNICLQAKIGEIYVTTWKSLVIKGIAPVSRSHWDQVLGKYRINVRHAANELNWQVEDLNEDGLILKRHVIRYFDKEDVRTYGLCFAVQTMPCSSMFGSVIIRRQQRKNPNRLKSLERFDILYKKDFNPNGTGLILFRDNVEKDHLGTYLLSLCKFFYEKENSSSLQVDVVTAPRAAGSGKMEEVAEIIYQCSECLSIYDNEYEDEENQVAAGTAFARVPDEYHCVLCGAGKTAFVERERRKLYA